MKGLILSFVLSVALQGATAGWLAAVAPIMTPAEKKIYLGLEPNAQERFRNEFWAARQISSEEYYRRLQYVDANFGSTKTASGANSDPGRVYLSLGAPNRITRLPSSRIFVPLEIWYYETAPAVNLNTELRVIFYQKNALGLPKLYSPTLDSIRALLLAQPTTVKMFGPNDNITESDIRKTLTVGPVEDEVLSTAVSVAAGITATGNDELIAQITSPEILLNRKPGTEVRSRVIAFHRKVDTFEMFSPYGGCQIDLKLDAEVRGDIELEVNQGGVSVYRDRVNLKFDKPKAVSYVHRLDLLPGSYTVMVSTDGQTYAYPLEVPVHPKTTTVLRVTPLALAAGQHAPFEFDGIQYQVDPEGELAMVPISRPGRVKWSIRRGFDVIARATSDAQQVGTWKLPLHELTPGDYRLEAASEDGDYESNLVIKASAEAPASRPVISYNANLAPALRYAAIGHQWLLRGNTAEARKSLQSSLDLHLTNSAQIELARADALDGNLDQARDRVRDVLAIQPKNFEALSVLAYIEAKFQDYAVAASLYRRALAVQDSTALRQALATLPVK